MTWAGAAGAMPTYGSIGVETQPVRSSHEVQRLCGDCSPSQFGTRDIRATDFLNNAGLVKVFSVRSKFIQYAYSYSREKVSFAAHFIGSSRYIIVLHVSKMNDVIIFNWKKIVWEKRCFGWRGALFDDLTFSAKFVDVSSVLINPTQSYPWSDIESWSIADIRDLQRDRGASASAAIFKWPDDLDINDFNPCPLAEDQAIASEFSLPLSRPGGFLGVSEAYENDIQLPEKQNSLSSANEEKSEREKSGWVSRKSLPEGFWLFCVLGALCSATLTDFVVRLWLMKKENNDKRKRKEKKCARADQAMRSG